MKNLKIKKALIPIITSLVLVTTGCSNKTNEVIEDNTINQTTEIIQILQMKLKIMKHKKPLTTLQLKK